MKLGINFWNVPGGAELDATTNDLYQELDGLLDNGGNCGSDCNVTMTCGLN